MFKKTVCSATAVIRIDGRINLRTGYIGLYGVHSVQVIKKGKGWRGLYWYKGVKIYPSISLYEAESINIRYAWTSRALAYPGHVSVH